MIRHLIALIVCLAFIQAATAQDQDPVLFTIDGKPIHVSEFTYIYNKNNGEKADYSKASLEEYLDLFVNYKLKVQKAMDMGLDTVPALQQELETYRRQLANSYLSDKEVVNNLVEELYERKKVDVRFSHILVQISPPQSANDTLVAYQKIMKAKQILDMGQPFDEVAKQFSDDQNTKRSGGDMGYMSAMLPDGFYNLENLIYTAPMNKVEGPIRTKLGYHLVKVTDRRPARGEMEVAHIFIRKSDKPQEEAKAKILIDSIYQLLKAGGNFEALAATYSEDRTTAARGGNIGVLRINMYDPEFENAAFSLKKDGDFSEPVESRVGWHIIKRIRKIDLGDFEQAKAVLKAQVERDSRIQSAKEVMIRDIKMDGHFTEHPDNYARFVGQLDSSFLTYKWRVAGNIPDESLFTLGDQMDFTTRQFANFLFTNSRNRVQMANSSGIKEVAANMYQQFVNESALKFEELNLKNKYPDFRNLMREYQEGILLFEATKQLVWDKASQDTTGLRTYFDTHRDNFMWKDRADLATVTLMTQDEKLIKKILKSLKKSPIDEVQKKFNTDSKKVIEYNLEKVERGSKSLMEMDWQAKAMSAAEKDDQHGTTTFRIIETIYPPARKTLDEARGYVIADYQDYLEKQWVKQLRDTYKVDVNQEVLDALVR